MKSSSFPYCFPFFKDIKSYGQGGGVKRETMSSDLNFRRMENHSCPGHRGSGVIFSSSVPEHVFKKRSIMLGGVQCEDERNRFFSS